jgi:hypothetical protein
VPTTASHGAKKQSSSTITLYDFIKDHHDVILARTSQRVASRSPSDSLHNVERGLPLFLTQLSETLRLETSETPFPTSAIGIAAAAHGRELVQGGYSVSQVVHDYGDVCQAITELALERKAPITVKEFHTLNRCLDAAIAEAVTEHARVTAQRT